MTTRERAEQLFVKIMAGRLTSNAAIDELLAFAAKERAEGFADARGLARTVAASEQLDWRHSDQAWAACGNICDRIRDLKGAPEAGHPRPSPSPQQNEEGK